MLIYRKLEVSIVLIGNMNRKIRLLAIPLQGAENYMIFDFLKGLLSPIEHI